MTQVVKIGQFYIKVKNESMVGLKVFSGKNVQLNFIGAICQQDIMGVLIFKIDLMQVKDKV